MAEDERKLFVGRLPQDIHEDEIRMIFDTYGRTADVHLMNKDRQQPGQDRCAFVTYETPEAAKVAMQVLNGKYKFRESAPEAIHVNIAFRRGKGGGGGGVKGNLSAGGRPHNNHPNDRDRYGGKGSYDRGPPMQRAHVDYDRGYDRGGPKGGYDRGGKAGPYDPGPSYERGGKSSYDRGFDRGFDHGYDRGCGGCGSYDRGPPPRRYDRPPERGGPRDMGRESGKGGGRKGGGPTKLYVGNLPMDITREVMDMVFRTYGRLEDIYIMNARAKNGQSCAFVVYSTPMEAHACVSAMAMGYEIRPGEGNIFVKYADDHKGGEKGGRGADNRYRPY